MPDVTDNPGRKKRYQAIAQQLRADIHTMRIPPGGRLPSERALSETYRVNRQTVRRALQDLREQGLVRSDRKGTYAVSPHAGGKASGTVQPTAPSPFPGQLAGPRPGAIATARLTRAAPPADVAEALGLPPGRPVLTHRHRIQEAQSIVQSSLSYLTDDLVCEVPPLQEAAALAAEGAAHPDLGELYRWMPAAGLRPVSRDSIAVLPPGRTGGDVPGLEVGAPLLGVRRTVHDQHGRALLLTDFRISTGKLVYESSLA